MIVPLFQANCRQRPSPVGSELALHPRNRYLGVVVLIAAAACGSLPLRKHDFPCSQIAAKGSLFGQMETLSMSASQAIRCEPGRCPRSPMASHRWNLHHQPGIPRFVVPTAASQRQIYEHQLTRISAAAGWLQLTLSQAKRRRSGINTAKLLAKLLRGRHPHPGTRQPRRRAIRKATLRREAPVAELRPERRILAARQTESRLPTASRKRHFRAPQVLQRKSQSRLRRAK